MDRQPWKRYVATICKEAWHLDVRSTEEVIRCIEDLISANPTERATAVQVFLGVGIGSPSTDRSARTVCIQISGGDPRRDTHGDANDCYVEEIRHHPVH